MNCVADWFSFVWYFPLFIFLLIRYQVDIIQQLIHIHFLFYIHCVCHFSFSCVSCIRGYGFCCSQDPSSKIHTLDSDSGSDTLGYFQHLDNSFSSPDTEREEPSDHATAAAVPVGGHGSSQLSAHKWYIHCELIRPVGFVYLLY